VLREVSAAGRWVGNVFAVLSREELKKKMESGKDFLLVDVRPKERYEDGHLPKAFHLPLDEIEERAERELKKDQEIVLYCSSSRCRKSRKGAETLSRMGFRRIGVYLGGIRDWKAGGFPIEGEKGD
jgi:rhodanese-related sulfurtransferase